MGIEIPSKNDTENLLFFLNIEFGTFVITLEDGVVRR